MKKIMLNEEMLEKVNGGADVKDIIGTKQYAPIFIPDDTPVIPTHVVPIDDIINREAIEKAIKELINDVKFEPAGTIKK